MNPRLIKGGQGRTDESLTADAKAWCVVMGWTVVAAIALAVGMWMAARMTG